MLRIMGRAKATVEQLRKYIKKVNPQASDAVTKLPAIYIAEGERSEEHTSELQSRI